MEKQNRYITGYEKIDGGYYKIPKQLFSERYKNLSLEAKFLYVIMRDLTDFSLRNKWIDERGNLYIMLSASKMARYAGCSERKARDLKKELIEHNLIESVTPKIGLPSRLYILKVEVPRELLTHAGFAQEPMQDLQETHAGFAQEPMQDLHTINNNIINNNLSITNNQEELEETSYIDIAPPPAAQSSSSDFNLFDYYQERIGVIDGTQMQKLNDYINFDDMEVELVKRAIDKAADNSKRYFNYIESILRGWKQNGIKTVVQQDEEQRVWDGRKSSKKKNSYIDEDEARRMQEKYGF